jgi:acetyl esterase/lipase
MGNFVAVLKGRSHMSTVHKKWLVALITLLLSILSFAATSAERVGPQPLTVDGATAHVYKSIGGEQLRLHVFSPDHPDALARRPAIVFFFGGGWTQGPVTQFAPQARHLAQRGMVAIVADYRVFGRHGTSAFESMADAKSAVRWVRSHSAQLGINPNRIAAGGGSSGGHIALSAAVFDTFDEVGEDITISSKPNALILFNPAVDTTQVPTEAQERFGSRGRDGSPIHHLRPGLPPTLILHGKSDTTVPYTDVDRFCAEAKQRGDQCQLIGYEGARHGFFNPQVADGKWYRETLLEADRFLTKLGYLPEPAPTHIDPPRVLTEPTQIW